MSKNIEKTLWISGIELSEISGSSYIPTALCYDSEDIFFGSEAIVKSKHKKIVNENFKVDLGDAVPGSTVKLKFLTESGKEVSAYELTKDFMEEVLSRIESQLPPKNDNYKIPAKIIVAEPLSFQVEGRHKNWIGNYRDNIRRILSQFSEVDFLPEPFAVYQYYRYGQKVPHLTTKSKHIALIIDFGGGTFDACVIESNAEGDVSQTGKHSKPIAADSVPVGGFVVNSSLAAYLIKRDLEDSGKKKVDSYLKIYERVKKGDLDFSSLASEKQIFIGNLRRLEDLCESYKIELVNKVKDWDLTAQPYEKINIKLPRNPFKEEVWSDAEFYAHQFRNTFDKYIWEASLKNVIRKVISIAKDSLGDKEVGITLISGGSSNIRWLERFLIRDFQEDLGEAEPVPISNSFQEIVAKGLAIESARRFYDKDSEFVSVTYNPIRLYMAPDGNKVETGKRYRSIGEKIDMLHAKQDELLPSAQALQNFLGKPIQWKVKLQHPPKHSLTYYFTRPGSGDYADCYNVESTIVYTSDKRFDSAVVIELSVREDGTAEPRFIYQADNPVSGIPENSETGRPFHIDMTTGNAIDREASTYIGFDFGTSSSSICLLSNADIKIMTQRQTNSEWTNLSKVLRHLPYPCAIALRKYLDVKNAPNSVSFAREVFESCLAFIAYAASAELMARKGLGTKLKDFQHRSMGPLKHLLEVSCKDLGSEALFLREFILLMGNRKDAINEATKDFTAHKHDKLSENDFNCHSHVSFIVGALVRFMEDKVFAYSSDIQKVPFSNPSRYKGLFKVAHDIPPFTESLPYESDFEFSTEEAVLIDLKTSMSISLVPFYFWSLTDSPEQPNKCFVYDKFEGDKAIVKPCDLSATKFACDIDVNLGGLLSEIRAKGIAPFDQERLVSLGLTE